MFGTEAGVGCKVGAGSNKGLFVGCLDGSSVGELSFSGDGVGN